MNAVYVVAPDTARFFPAGLESHPGDGHNIQWIIPNDIGTLKELTERIKKFAASAPINVLRFLGHGSPGSVAVLGRNRQTLDFSKPHTMDAVNGLKGIFDSRSGARREIFLHACEAANDEKLDIKDGRIVGGPRRDKYGSSEAPGYTLLQGLANTLLVPTIGPLQFIYVPSHLSARGNYNWTLPKSLYVYPNVDPRNALELADVRGWGASYGGELDGSITGPYVTTRNSKNTMVAHALSGTGVVHPLGPVWVSGVLTKNGNSYSGAVRLNSKSTVVSLSVKGTEDGPGILPPPPGHDFGSSKLTYGEEQASGEFSNSQFKGTALYTWDFAAQQRTAYTLRFQTRS